jgi:hypothetical protein
MNLSDEVRNYCEEKYIDPARKSGKKTIRIRSGDVHTACVFSTGFKYF